MMRSLIVFLVPLIQAYEYKGITFTNGKYCPNVTFDSEDAAYSLLQLQATGANYVAVVVTQYQETLNSTNIEAFYEPMYSHHYTYLTETEQDLETIVNKAHSIGLKVMMKMHIDLYNDDEHWRGDIGYYHDEATWEQWFDSYSKALLGYANLSERLGVESFSVSCELIEVSRQEQHWRRLISQIREVYSGQLTSSANWGYLTAKGGEDTNKTWWDALDFIGVDAYYNYDQNLTNPTLEDLVEAWTPVVRRLDYLSTKWNKKVVLTEIGYCSGKCARDYTPNRKDFEVQAKYYEAAFLALQDWDWFDGYFWWSWNTDPRNGGKKDNCITPQNKPAEEVIRKYYEGTNRIPYLEGESKCLCTV